MDDEQLTAQSLFSEQRPVKFLVEAVCVRPKMYTIGGTLEEAVAFLQGFYSGMGAHKSLPSAQTEAQQWWEFCDWMRNYLPEAKSPAWYDIFTAVRQRYPNDVHAFYQVALWFTMFVESSR